MCFGVFGHSKKTSQVSGRIIGLQNKSKSQKQIKNLSPFNKVIERKKLKTGEDHN